MLPLKSYKDFGKRVKFNLITFGTLFNWDKETEHLKPAHPMMTFQVYFGIISGFGFAGMHMIQMYLKTHESELPEAGSTGKKHTDFREFATLMIEGGEIILIVCVALLALVLAQRDKIFIYLVNQLIDYNKKLSEMIKSGQLVLTEKQENVIKLVNLLNYLVMFISATLPFGIVIVVHAKIEPTNQMFEEWLEIPFEFSLKLAPLIALMISTALGVAITLALMMIVISIYYMTALICTEALLPEKVRLTPKDGVGRCKLKTVGFGKLADLEVVHLYRIQQILNMYLNTFFRSVLVAFHHVGCLAIVVTLLVFSIKFHSLISEEGVLAYIVVFSSMMSTFVMIFFQSKMSGAVVDISEEFKFAPRKIMPSRLLFRKFARSCSTFYIEVTYPFYTVNRETFAGFMQQAQDYSMQLLLG